MAPTMENTDKLKKKRQIIRGLVTKLNNKIKDSLETEITDFNLLEEYKNQLIEKELQLRELDNDIENTCNLDELEREVESNQEWKDAIISMKTKLNLKLNCKPLLTTTNVDTVADTVTNVTHDHRKPDKLTVKLPKLEVAKFEGQFENWQTFWSQFNSAVNENKSLSCIDKFIYLKGSLTGSALNAIQGLEITDQNYDIAVNILKARFGKKELVISAHINKLLKLTPVKRSFQVKELRRLYDESITQIRSLDSLGVDINSYGNLLFPMMLQLIPEEIVLEFNRFKKEDNQWDVTGLLEFLRAEIENRERSNLFRKDSDGKHNERTSAFSPELNKYLEKPFERKKRIPSAATFNTTSKNYCLFCSLEHDQEKCNLTVAEKKRSLLKQGRCYNCLKRNHVIKNCMNKISCSICNRKHNKLICDKLEPKIVTDQNESQNETTLVSSVMSVNKRQGRVMLQTATVLAANKKKEKETLIMFDQGSEQTFICEDLSKHLQLQVIGEETLNIYTFGCEKPSHQIRKRVRVVVKNMFNPKKKIEIDALEVPKISDAPIYSPNKKIREYCLLNKMQLADLETKEPNNNKISLLIGSDVYWKIVTGKIHRIPGTNMVAIETKMGWVLNGVDNSAINQRETQILKVCARKVEVSEDDSLNQLLRNLWESDYLEAVDNKNKIDSQEQDVVHNEFEKTVQFKEGRYIVRLPWNENKHKLEDNYRNAEKRFWNLIRQFRRDSNLFERYKSVIDKHLNDGIAERVETKSRISKDGICYYMPHRSVIREDKSTKLRVVFDATSSTPNSLSLNDCLDSGPNLNPDLLSLLINFRKNCIAITADLEQAFLQIKLDPQDRDAVRFLWLSETDNLETIRKPDILRMSRVLFGATSSPFLLAATLKYHIDKYKKEFPQVYDILNKKIYVDDLITSLDSEKETMELHTVTKHIFQQGGFNMRKWRTSNPTLQELWGKDENIENVEKIKVLGYVWNPVEDRLKIDLGNLVRDISQRIREPTKREILKTIGRIFDPLGFVSPYTIRSKILLQEIWRRNLKWDEALPLDLVRVWTKWCEELHILNSIEVPRHFLGQTCVEFITDLEYHCFVDASKRGFGTVLYACFKDANGKIKSNLISSKARVAPVREITLPRLELLAAVQGARLYKYLKENLIFQNNTTTYFWTDSMIVLHWIQGCSRKLKPFVKNRIIEIKSITDSAFWAHCSSEENPADFLSRGIPLESLKESKMWWHGPNWIKERQNHWPKEETKHIDTEESEKEYTKTAIVCTVLQSEPLFNLQKFSKLIKILRITAWCMRFIHNLKNSEKKMCGTLNAEELQEAEKYWIKKIQGEHFPEELQNLKQKENISSSSQLKALCPILDLEEIIRVGGRIEDANIIFEEAHPIIMPNRSYLTELLIERSHWRNGHAGVSGTLTDLREKFYILKARQKIKSSIYKCNICKKFRSKPALQDMAKLPPDRVREAHPFEITGVDYAGPLYVKNGSMTNKCYILLFTCAVTRALHLELTHDMTAEVFLQAFKKFIARRGICKTIYSDNAQTFKKTKKNLNLLQECAKNEKIQTYSSERGITWKFIIERAAWWGGFWERMVRSVKECLKKILGKSSLSFLELEVIVIEVEAILNSRPLTFVYSDQGEPDPLTPGHFIIGRRLLSIPEAQCRVSSTKDSILKKHKHQIMLTNHIWKRWRKEYLLQLRSAHQSTTAKYPLSIKKGDVVQIFEEKIPKLMWKLGTVEDLHQGRDGKLRSCSIRLSTGTHIRRPVQLLYPLEL